MLNQNLATLYQNANLSPIMTHKSAKKIKSKSRHLVTDDLEPKPQFHFKWIFANQGFKNFIGYNHILIEICNNLLHLTLPQHYMRSILTSPVGILIHGPPGTGKSFLPEVIAGEFGSPLARVSATDLYSTIGGIGEKKIQKLFDEAYLWSSYLKGTTLTNNDFATHSPIFIFIDEIDLLVPKSDIAMKDGDKRIIAQLVSCLDELGKRPNSRVFVIASTSNVDAIDPSVRRTGRFDKEIILGMPNEACRFKLLQHFCSNLELSNDIDFKKIVRNTPGFVAADLKALISEACIASMTRIQSKLTAFTVPKSSVLNSDQYQDSHLEAYVNYIKSQFNARDTRLNEPIKITTEDFDKALASIVPSCKREGFYTASILNENITDYVSNSSLMGLPDTSCLPNQNSSRSAEEPQWDSGIGALFEIKKEITLCLRGAVKYPEVYELYGLANTGSGVLLVGPPGCGKTLLAKAVARESALNFIAVKGPELLNMYVGETERAVRKCFARARDSAPCLVFFDEIDSLCPRRGGGNEDSGLGESSTAGCDSSASRIVNQLLTEMDGIDSRNKVFVMGATNRLDVLDKAILRPGRFDKIFYVGLPTIEERIDILRVLTRDCDNVSRTFRMNHVKYTQKTVLSTSLYGPCVDLAQIANDPRCHGFSGADLSALVKEASRQALKDIIEYNERDVLNSIDEEKNYINHLNHNENAGISKTKYMGFDEQSMESPEVKMKHFDEALNIIKPSISAKELKNYEKIANLHMCINK